MWLAGGINIDIYLTFLPKANILSKIVSLLLMTVTDIESLAILKTTSALYWRFLLQLSILEEVTLLLVSICFNLLTKKGGDLFS